MSRTRSLLAPTVVTGALMAAYLLLRPYGDAHEPTEAQAYTSPAWVVSHLCGILALAAVAVLVGRLARQVPGRGVAVADALALPSVVLIALYYGAETFALAVVADALPQSDALALVDGIRNHPVAMTAFALGLVGLGVAALLAARAWQRSEKVAGWALCPLAVMVALVLPQFFLPVAGRMAFGVVYAIAAAVFARALLVQREG